MRLFLSSMSLGMILISGCSTQNAFEAFKIDTKSERAITGLRTITLFQEHRVAIVLSSVYLNYVEPQRFQGAEHFLIACYTETPTIITTMRLNGAVPQEVTPLDPDDALLTYLPIYNEWNRYFLITFPQQNEETLTLKPDSDLNATGTISYQKDAR